MSARWTDGRSGAVGRFVGQIALDDLQVWSGGLSNWKGTVFVSEGTVVLGRTAQEEYTRAGNQQCAMWANVSEVQVEDLRDEFGAAEIRFLLVSLSRDRSFLRTWLIPYKAVRKHIFLAAEAKGNGDQWDLKIDERAGRWLMGEGDVTEYYRELTLSPSQRQALAGAFQEEESKRKPASSNRHAESIGRVKEDSRAGSHVTPIRLVFEGLGYKVELTGVVTAG